MLGRAGAAATVERVLPALVAGAGTGTGGAATRADRVLVAVDGWAAGRSALLGLGPAIRRLWADVFGVDRAGAGALGGDCAAAWTSVCSSWVGRMIPKETSSTWWRLDLRSELCYLGARTGRCSYCAPRRREAIRSSRPKDAVSKVGAILSNCGHTCRHGAPIVGYLALENMD